MRLLDLFCGAGGAAMGYYCAGFTEIVGVDIERQKRYPFDFVQADAMEFDLGGGFDVIHASPPCQGYSIMRHLPWLKEREWPMLIEPCRDRFREALATQQISAYVIENVASAPLVNGVTLCGLQFDLPIYRHRKFESNLLLMSPGMHFKHFLKGGRAHRDWSWRDEEKRNVGQPVIVAPFARPGRTSLGSRRPENRRNLGSPRVVGISTFTKNQPTSEWGLPRVVGVAGHFGGVALVREAMGIDWMTRDELSQAIPPAYTEFLGHQLLDALR